MNIKQWWWKFQRRNKYTRNALALRLGYKNEKEWDKQLSDPEYIKYIKKCSEFIGRCYVLGSDAYGNTNRK